MSATTTAVAVAGVLVLYTVYRWVLPKPIPGIPYNPEAVTSLLGDLPGLRREMQGRGDFFLWLRDQNLKSRSAISQIFIIPFGKPVVVLADHRESRDIQLHRMKDFDRSSLVIDSFTPLVGITQFTVKTGPTWKMHRRLTKESMTPKFLDNVAAPNIYASSLRFVELWGIKSDLASGRPFSAESDLFFATLDSVLAFTFGSDYPHSATRAQVDGARTLSEGDLGLGSSKDEPVKFPQFDIDEEIESTLKLVAEMENVQGKPLPTLQWFLIKRKAQFKRMEALKDELIRREVAQAVEKLSDASFDESSARNGVEIAVYSEAISAQVDNRKPDFYSDMIRNELFGLLVAGHDTTSSTLCWSVKLLSEHGDCQARLRRELQSAYAAAVSENRQPSVHEITRTPIPYLDAVIEELFRLGGVIRLNSREAIRDTELLGHHIPKGTTVVYLLNGPSYTMPAYEVDESLRSGRSQKDKGSHNYSWSEDDIALFKPERWLVETQPGSVAFDANAGPTNPFGLGLRSCFGRRLAYIQFRILLTMLLWNFELLDCPKELSGNTGRVGIVYKPCDTYIRLKKVV